MTIRVRAYRSEDIAAMCDIWNAIVDEGIAFPHEETLNETSGRAFFAEQTHCGVAYDTENGRILGLYILHPNNIGRCGHICNASYAVASDMRNQGIGEALVRDCMQQGAAHGFRVLQFNAVVKTNFAARHLYEKLGFTQLGTIIGGFRKSDGSYEDICPYYISLITE